ncbi:MAG: TIGR03619 family F420-dependent LLM class oxidoreductase [Chloroflexota bacterium]|nr:TIGR03619 family F420-dependent LLM class oxidoreductase [Chloroflexota bacterium]
MKFGMALTTAATPVYKESEQRDLMVEALKVSESKGYESAWVSDRTLYPSDISQRYPQQFGPGKSNPDAQNVLESLTTLSFIAGKTQTIRLGTSVLVLPFRNPLLNTKMISTLDVLSEGRLILGIGSGWMKEEFDSMDASYLNKESVTDEHLEFLLHAGTDPSPEYVGTHINTQGMRLFPQPFNMRSIPIWVGGNSDRSLLRTANYGDFWHGINLTPSELENKTNKLKSICESQEKNYSAIGISLRATVKITDNPITISEERPYLTGTIEQIEKDLEEYRRAGLEYLVLSMAGDSKEGVVRSIETFADNFL